MRRRQDESLTERKIVFPRKCGVPTIAHYAYNTTHQRFDDIAKLKRRILSAR